jgi:hypothetical protein
MHEGGYRGRLPLLRLPDSDQARGITDRGVSWSPPGQLPAVDVNPVDFAAFWVARGLTVEDGIALMGSHSLVDAQECFRYAYAFILSGIPACTWTERSTPLALQGQEQQPA